MKIGVIHDGSEVGSDDLIIASGPTRIWPYVDMGRDVEPVVGAFSFDGLPAGPTRHPVFQQSAGRWYQPRSWVAKHELEFVPGQPLRGSELLTECQAGESQGECSPGSDAPSGSAPDGGPERRTLWFVNRACIRLLFLLAAVAIFFLVASSWVIGIAFEHHKSAPASLLPPSLLFPGVTAILTVFAGGLGIGWAGVRSWLVRHWRPSVLSLIVLALAALIAPSWFVKTVTNASKDDVVPVAGLGTKLAPGATTVYRLSEALATRTAHSLCTLGKECQQSDGSLTFRLLNALSASTHVYRCKHGARAAGLFPNEFELLGGCPPNPEASSRRSYSDIAEYLDSKRKKDECEKATPGSPECTDPVLPGDGSSGEYVLAPFAHDLGPRLDEIDDATFKVKWPEGEAPQYSELLVYGQELIRQVKVQLPVAGRATFFAPWPRERASVLTAKLVSGALHVATLECPLAKQTKGLEIRFTQSGSHMRRLIVRNDTEPCDNCPNTHRDAPWRSVFSVERPELVMHVPWCNRPARSLTIEIYLDTNWTPEGWSMVVPDQVRTVQVHGADGTRWGTLITEGHCEKLVPLPRLQGLKQVERDSRGPDKASEARLWISSLSSERERQVAWACHGDSEWIVELIDGKRRVTSAPQFRLDPLPDRICYFDATTGALIPRPANWRTVCTQNAQTHLAAFPRVGCHLTESRMCQ